MGQPGKIFWLMGTFGEAGQKRKASQTHALRDRMAACRHFWRSWVWQAGEARLVLITYMPTHRCGSYNIVRKGVPDADRAKGIEGASFTQRDVPCEWSLVVYE